MLQPVRLHLCLSSSISMAILRLHFLDAIAHRARSCSIAACPQADSHRLFLPAEAPPLRSQESAALRRSTSQSSFFSRFQSSARGVDVVVRSDKLQRLSEQSDKHHSKVVEQTGRQTNSLRQSGQVYDETGSVNRCESLELSSELRSG